MEITERKSESGAIAIIIALLMTMFLGFTAFVVDVGYLYEVKRQLQSAADAGALAGAQELINESTDEDILNVAEDYAKRNDFPSDSDPVLSMLGAPYTEIGDNYVKVTVEKEVNLFFARIFGITSSTVNAQAKAQVVNLTGAKGLVPWGLQIIRPTRVTAQIEGGPEEALSSSGSQTFSGTLSSIPAVARTSGYSLTVKVYNEQDFPETVFPAAYINVFNPADPIKKVWFSKNYLESGGSTTLYVESTGGRPSVRFNGRNYNLNGTGPLYSLTLSAPNITYAVEYFPVEVSVGSGANTFKLTNASVLVVRRSAYPIRSVALDQNNFVAGAGDSADITVETNDFVFGESYDLKVVAGGETGNFNPLDFRYIWHPTSYTNNHGQNDSAADYYDNISGSYPGEIHIGDIVSTQTGNLSAPSTARALETRFGTDASHDWAWFVANGQPRGCHKIVLVPVIEKIERLNGKSEVIVVELAAFFIENIPDQGLNIQGRFVEYVMPGTYTEEPPDGLYMMTVRLVPPDF